MRSINRHTVLGNVGKDPEVRTTTNGTTVANITVATNYTYVSNDEKQEGTDWHNVVFFGPLAEIVAKYVSKGTKVYVEGPSQTRSWEDKDGNTRYTTQINGRELVLLGGNRGGSNGASSEEGELVGTPGGQADDELPF